MLFGIIGLNGSGKDTVADYLVEKYGFVHYGCGQAVRDELKRLKRNHLDRNEMIELANKMRKENGNDYLVKYIFDKFQNEKKLIISSLRNPAEIKFIKSRGGKLIKVTADQKVRFGRVSKRVANDSLKHGTNNFEEFKEQEERELQSSDPSKQQLTKCLDMADIKIDNSGSIDDLKKQIDNLMTN